MRIPRVVYAYSTRCANVNNALKTLKNVSEQLIMTIEMIFLHFVLFFTDLLCKKNSTVKIMILSRYRNRRVTVFKSSLFMVALRPSSWPHRLRQYSYYLKPFSNRF